MSKIYRLLVLILIPIIFGQIPAISSTIDKESKKHIALLNFHKVHDYLYRGGQPKYNGYETLKNTGITCIVNLRNNPKKISEEKAICKKMGFEYIVLPMSSKAPTQKQVATFIKAVENAKQNNTKVYVHCAHGSDRTGCMVGIWRVTHDDYSYKQAYQEMLKYYFSPQYVKLSGAVKQYVKK